MGQQVHIKLLDVLMKLGKEDKIEIYNETYAAIGKPGEDGYEAEAVFPVCRISLIGRSFDYPNISFALSMSWDVNSMCMDFNAWGDDYELKREFIERLDVTHIIS